MTANRVDAGEDDFKNGESLREKRRAEEALSEIERLFSANPGNPAVKSHLFSCHFQQGFERFSKMDLEGALGHFERAHALFPEHEQARINLTILYNQQGTILYEGGSPDAAVPVFRQALELVPDNQIAKTYLFSYHFGRALKLIEVQDFDGAIEHLEQGNALTPGHEQICRSLGLLYYQKGAALFGEGRIEEALPCFTRSLSVSPGNAFAANYLFSCHFQLGIALVGRQDMGGAIPHFEAAFAQNAAHKIKHRDLIFHTYQLGTAHYTRKEYEEAIRYYKQAVAIKPDTGDFDDGVIKNIYLFWWTAAINSERHEDFIEFSKKTLIDGPVLEEHREWTAASCREVGAILQNFGACADTIPFFLRLVSLFPSDIGAHNALGACFLARNEHIKGIRHYTRSMKCNPSQSDPPYRISQILMLKKGPEAAARFCRHMLKVQPSNILIKKELASIPQFPGAGDGFPYYPFPRYGIDRAVWSKARGPGRRAPRSREKVRILCFGPCQGFGISRVLEPLLKPVVDASIFYVNTGQTHLSEILIRKYTKYADVAIYRKRTSSSTLPEEVQAYEAMQSELADDTLKISFPAMENWGLWPINIFSNRVDTSKSVQELLRSDCSLDRIVQAYDAGELDFDFSKRFRESMAIMKFTERYTDIKLHDYINENIKDKILFTYGAHPAKSLYIECARQIYQAMAGANIIGEPFSDDALSIYESWPDDIIHPAEFFPIDKYAYKHFGFNWCSAESIHDSTPYYHALLQMARGLMLGAFRK